MSSFILFIFNLNVPKERLELSSLSAAASKTAVSANSTIRVYCSP